MTSQLSPLAVAAGCSGLQKVGQLLGLEAVEVTPRWEWSLISQLHCGSQQPAQRPHERAVLEASWCKGDPGLEDQRALRPDGVVTVTPVPATEGTVAALVAV